MISIGVVGYGYWGPNLVRNFSEEGRTRVVGICDASEQRLCVARGRFPGALTTTNATDLIRDPNVDAIAIATPVSSHFDLALSALKAGKHVLVEKPLTADSGQAMQLIEEANRRRLVLMVDHTFVYTGAVRKIKELIDAGRLGEIYYYDSVRVNLGLFQNDVNVLWDLAVHDLAIMDYLLPSRPRAVSSVGMSHMAGHPENIAYVTVLFEDSTIGHVHVNWTAPLKIRRTLIGGSLQMVVYDDVEPSEKVKIYDKGVLSENTPNSVYQMMVSYRTGDMWAPKLDDKEALSREVTEFVDCISDGRTPTSDGHAGLRVVRLLEAATASLREEGHPVDL